MGHPDFKEAECGHCEVSACIAIPRRGPASDCKGNRRLSMPPAAARCCLSAGEACSRSRSVLTAGGAPDDESRENLEGWNPIMRPHIGKIRGRGGRPAQDSIKQDVLAACGNERGFTLLEIIITFILAAFVGSMLVEYMGSSLTRGGEAVIMVQDGFSANGIMEKIIAEYEDEYKNGSYDFSTFKANVEGGNDDTHTPYYGNYTVGTSYITFDGSNAEAADTSGSNNLLKVTITVANQSLTTVFRK